MMLGGHPEATEADPDGAVAAAGQHAPEMLASSSAPGTRAVNPEEAPGRGTTPGGVAVPTLAGVVTIDDVRRVASRLERSYEVLVRDRVKFRVGRLVYLAFSRDETLMGFAFPKEEREALVASEPHKFLMPEPADLRYHWVVVRLDAIDLDEMWELVVDAWGMVVPKKLRDSITAPG